MSWSVPRPRGLLLVALRQAAFGGAGVTRAECLRDDPERAAFADLLGRVGDQRREVGEDAEADHLERLEPDLEQDRRDDPGEIRGQGGGPGPRPPAATPAAGASGAAEAAKRAAGTAELMKAWSSPERRTASSARARARVGSSPRMTRYVASGKVRARISASAREPRRR